MSAPPAGDTILSLFKHLDERIEQLAQRQDTIAEVVSQQNQAFAGLFQQLPPQFLASASPPMLPQLPGSLPPGGFGVLPPPPGAIVPAPPPGYGLPAPMQGSMYPATGYLPIPEKPIVRRDTSRVVLHNTYGSQQTLAAVEVTSTSDPLNNTETQEVTTHRYANRGGELIDCARSLYACVECHDLTNDPIHCSQCGAAMCQPHVYVGDTDPETGQGHDVRCRKHRIIRGLLDALFG